MRPEKTPPPRKLKAPTLACLRSAVSNGTQLLPDLDHRSSWARRLRDLVSDHVSDLGGQDLISTSELVLVRRASMLTLQLEMMEANWAHNNEGIAGAKSLMNYQRATNTLRRTLEALGLRRRQRDVTPDLSDYIESRRGRPSAADIEEAEEADA